MIGTIALIAVPLLLSLFLHAPKEDSKKVNVVVVQPNVDPYNEKFNTGFKEQLNKMLTLANKAVDSTTDYLVFPETALTENIDESRWNESYSIDTLNYYLRKHPHLSIIAGAESYRVYSPAETPPPSAHKIANSNESYDDYNTVIELDAKAPVQVYHKCKLVPGVEVMPFEAVLAPLAKLAFDLGGTSGTLGTQKEPSVFYSPSSKTTSAAAICYESIYGEYLGEFIKKGAQIVFIVTNDGWWKDTPGYRQHLCYARLRAIETRRCIARSANTGISAFIDADGNILQRTNWWEPAVIKATLPAYSGITFYTQYGDYIGKLACTLSALILTLAIFLIIRNKKPS
jgi:apolipoprotein N-acyltransferase